VYEFRLFFAAVSVVRKNNVPRKDSGFWGESNEEYGIAPWKIFKFTLKWFTLMSF